MALQTVTLRLPDSIYRQIERRAQRMRHSVEDELVVVVSSALPTLDDLPSDIADRPWSMPMSRPSTTGSPPSSRKRDAN